MPRGPKQSRLTFAPVPPSSPPPPPAIEHSSPGDSPGRLARLRYGRPHKSFLHRGGSRIDDYLTQRGDHTRASDATTKEGSGPESPAKSSKSAKGSRATATKIATSESESDVSSEDEIMVTTRGKQRNDESGVDNKPGDVGTTGGAKRKGKEASSKDSKSKTKRGVEEIKPSRQSQRHNSSRDNTEKEVKGLRSAKRSPEPAKHTSSKEPVSISSSDEDSPGATGADEDETVDSDENLVLPSPAKKRKRDADVEPSETSRRTPEQEKIDLEEDLQDLQGSVVKETRTRGRQANPERQKRQQQLEALRRKRTGARTQSSLESERESDGDLIVSSPVKKRRRNTDAEQPRTPRRTPEQDKVDIEEDLQDLQDSVVKETRTRGRQANPERQKRQKQLEALRRKRTGARTPSSSESEPEQEPENPETNENESEPDAEPEPPQPENVENAADASDEDLDRYEDDFVLEDDESLIGVPTDMPFEFSRHAYKKTKDYFRDAVEWMVHNKLNPAFPRTDALYEVAFTKLEDEVKGRVGSQIISTVWAPTFQYALMARPHLEVTWFPVSENHICDACNRGSHPASFELRLHGKAYSLRTLEPISDDESDDNDDDEDEEEEDTVERDRNGNILPDENTRFRLGRHCKEKATLAHTLSHWRYHLNEWVVDHLYHQGILDDDQLLERSRWSVKKQTRYANEVVGMLDRTGEVQSLWRDFHITLKAARETTSV